MAKYIVVAEEGEKELLEKCFASDGPVRLDASWRDAKVIYTGVGAINVIRALQDLPREAELLNIGYAGSANFEIGTWAQVTEVQLNHPNVRYDEPKLPLDLLTLPDSSVIRAMCYSNCDFVLQSDYHDCVFDMELAFIAAMGFAKVHSLKYVSDNLSLHDYHNLTNGVQ